MNFWEVFVCGICIGVFVGIWVAYLLNMMGEKRRSKGEQLEPLQEGDEL